MVVPELAEIAGGEPVYVGGPVQPEALVAAGRVLRSRAPRPGSWSPTSASPRPTSISTSSPDAVRRGRVYAGYSGWGAGQLEAEIEMDSWIIEPPLPAELFPEDPATLWSDVLARKGGQYALIARMPADPSQN